MTAAEIIRVVYGSGMTIRLADNGLAISPASALTDELRQTIRENKPALIKFLEDARITLAEVIKLAMDYCDQTGNDDEREDWRTQLSEMEPHLLDDAKRLLEELQRRPV